MTTPRTYELDSDDAGEYIVCLDCKREGRQSRSYHPADVSERYCGNCHEFHSQKAARAQLYLARSL